MSIEVYTQDWECTICLKVKATCTLVERPEGEIIFLQPPGWRMRLNVVDPKKLFSVVCPKCAEELEQ